MRTKGKGIFAFLVFFLLIFSITSQNNLKDGIETMQEDLKIRTYNLKPAGFWNNFTFIHITDLNWTIANQSDWCSGSGTWRSPYLIENMIINATDSPVGCGIFIENSINVYFTIKNVTIFGSANGIKLENTNNGALIRNLLSGNLDSGINMINCANNTLLRNTLMNNGLCGINLTSNCNNNRILENTVKNEGTNFQDTGIYLRSFCDNNDIFGNSIYDNNVYGINIDNNCEENIIFNNTITNKATNQQDYGIRLHTDCDQNTISLNLFEDLNNYGIYMVTSDQSYVAGNQIIDCGTGMWMLIDFQTEITDNTISGGSYGIIMSACDGGKIYRNFINETVNYAIRIILNSDNNEFYDNVIKDNINMGIQLDDPSDTNNNFYKNAFISNGIHAYDNGTANFWDNSVIGNYWDDYTGEDLNTDHIGDTSYNISGDANANDTLPMYDHGVPVITINTPTSSTYGTNAPEFNIFINDPYIYSMWYVINNSGVKYYFTENGTINEEVWDALADGNVIITFYVRDIAWNLGSNSVNLVKGISEGPHNGNPPLDVIIIIVIGIIVILIIAVTIIVMRVSLKRRIKKSRKLNEEQLSEAQYFKDITSILTILAIHNESGLCLSKMALHGGIGLDENLFTGFISAIGSFKNELAKQMGLQVRGEGGDNVIEYKEFTITLMDGVYLRLGLVSYSSLGDLIKEKCGQILRAYENKHIDDLKNFDGELQVFNDFEESIKKGLDVNLNKKCIINVKQLDKYDAPESFKTILKDFKSKSDGFYPAEVTYTLVREMDISDQEANFLVYEAYKNQIFLPIN
ncbi:MAG: nitrous oxide reductase family maturation protein NosD [Candidatus Heimdallarchaeota archaeon]